MTIKILVVDDHISVRKELRKVLNRNPKIEVVGEASGGKEALDLSKRLDPDVMLLDVEMPDMNGLELAGEIRKISPSVKIILLTAYSHYKADLSSWAADAYVVKSSDFSILKQEIQRLL